MDIATSDDRAGAFERLRPRLFGIAYRMLGAVEDAEDVVQETYLRWHGADAAAMRSAEAWLVAVATRLSIDRLRRAATEREAYVGRWLPEPIAGVGAGAAPDQASELASDLSMAFLVLLERLAPEERAAFLLREVFGEGYGEIAAALEKSEAACRQIVHRARERVRRDRPRFRAPAEARERLLHRFVAALAAEDRDDLLSLLAEDAAWVSDGGGRAPAVRELAGAERIVQLLLGYERKARGRVEHRVIRINGEPALLTLSEGRTLFTTSFDTDGERIHAVYRVLNPRKLRHVGPEPLFEDAWPRRAR